MMIRMRTLLAALAAVFVHATVVGQTTDERVIEAAPPNWPDLRELSIVRSNMANAPSTITVKASEIPAEPTRIFDNDAAEKLFGNSGVTLQWIGWEDRGQAWVAIDDHGHWLLTGGQVGQEDSRMELEGFVTEIGPDYFTFEGTIKIRGAPDRTRLCNTTKVWRFAVTQNRKYWRLREFEWCDGLTDYIDIYF